MSTSPESAAFILDALGDRTIFTVRRMFGEFCLYAHGKPVGFICNDTLFVKIASASMPLERLCEKGECYPGSKDYYIVDEGQLHMPELPNILRAVAESIPEKKK